MIFQTNSLRLGEKEYNRKMFERKGRGKMKKKGKFTSPSCFVVQYLFVWCGRFSGNIHS